MERTHGVEPRAAEIEFDAVAEDRGGQRISVPREDVAPLGRDDLFGEDASGEPFGIVGDLRAEELHPYQTCEDEQSRQDEEDVEQPHPQQDVAFDARFFRFHLAHQSSRISPGTTGSYKSMPRRRSSSRMAEWVVWRKRCS